MKQSAVSRRIQALEDELGVSLFERQSNGVRLTIAGQRFLERTRAAFAEIAYAIKNAAAAGRGAEGVLRIGVLPSFFPDYLSDLLANFCAAQPGVMVDLLDGPPHKLTARIIERRLDVAFVVNGTPTPGCDVEIPRNGGIRLALADRHPLARCELIDWKLLKDEHFVFGREVIAAGLDDHASRTVAGLGGRLSFASFDASHNVMMRLVALGFGLSLVSDWCTAIVYPGVAFRRLAGDNQHVSYSAVWLPGNDNPALRRFLSLARQTSPQQHASPLPKSAR